MPLLRKRVRPETGLWGPVAPQAADLTRLPGQLSVVDMDNLVHLRLSAVKVQRFAGVHRRSLEPGLKLRLSANRTCFPSWSRQLATDTAHRQAVPVGPVSRDAKSTLDAVVELCNFR